MYNTTLHPDEYAALADETASYQQAVQHGARVDHPHRRWEHSLALHAIRTHDCRTVLDVGAASSGFPLMVAMDGRAVMAIDSSAEIHWLHNFVFRFPGRIDYRQVDLDGGLKRAALETYDAVCALSVIEHVPDATAFFDQLLTRATKLVIVTTDFDPTGARHSPDHLRTYAAKDLKALATRAKRKGWQPVDTPAWDDRGAFVNGYSFAALVLERIP